MPTESRDGIVPETAPGLAPERANDESEDIEMAWKTPRVVEISVGMEINCYACADI